MQSQTAYFSSSYSMANIRCGCWSVASLKFHYKPHLLICGFIKLLSSKMTNSKNCGIHAVLAFYCWIHAALQKFESENTEEWCIPFWNIFFRFRDIDSFVLCKLGKLFCHEVCYSWITNINIEALFFKLGTRNGVCLMRESASHASHTVRVMRVMRATVLTWKKILN